MYTRTKLRACPVTWFFFCLMNCVLFFCLFFFFLSDNGAAFSCWHRDLLKHGCLFINRQFMRRWKKKNKPYARSRVLWVVFLVQRTHRDEMRVLWLVWTLVARDFTSPHCDSTCNTACSLNLPMLPFHTDFLRVCCVCIYASRIAGFHSTLGDCGIINHKMNRWPLTTVQKMQPYSFKANVYASTFVGKVPAVFLVPNSYCFFVRFIIIIIIDLVEPNCNN